MAEVVLYHGNCLDVLPTLEADSIPTMIVDPPAGIKFMGKRWDDLTGHKPRTERAIKVWLILESFVSLGFLQGWEAGFVLFTVDWATAAFRVLMPGATGLVWALPRTSELVCLGLRLAGFEVRDRIAHVFGTGFPKSHDISKAIDKAAGAEREVVGRRVRLGDRTDYPSNGDSIFAGSETGVVTSPATPAAQLWDGWGTGLKPAMEDWWVVMKPLDGTFANNALVHGVAGLNIDGGRVPAGDDHKKNCNRRAVESHWRLNASPRRAVTASPLGRCPANLIHDGSDEVARLFPVTNTKPGSPVRNNKSRPYGSERTWQTSITPAQQTIGYTDIGSAARFFYCAKASKKERTNGGEIENDHPTVKPLALMRYLCCLTNTPTNGPVLDFMMGSGSTLVAAVLEGRGAIGIEIDEGYFNIAKERIARAQAEIVQLGLEGISQKGNSDV